MNPVVLNPKINRHDVATIVALDFPSSEEALHFTRRLSPTLCKLKVGNELFTGSGKKLVETLVNQGFQVFLDLKFHDIPNTVAEACRNAANMGVWMVNVHASGGKRMLEAAANALASLNHRPLLIAVTVLTSLNKQDGEFLFGSPNIENRVLRLSQLAKEAGLDGVVSSAQEIRAIKKICGLDFLTVTPGIRDKQDTRGDQVRTLSAKDALIAGSDYLVIGRPIRSLSNPLARLEELYQLQKSIRGQDA